jgi:asparagine synthase (glutamine-hydrolysing)
MVANPLDPRDGGVASHAIVAAGMPLDEVLSRWWGEVADRDPVSQPMLVDLMSYLPGDILTKVDRMSMAASIEARVPLLDHHMVEFAVTVPTKLKLKDGTGKWIFREAVRDLVPDPVFSKRKQGFGVPLQAWLRNELRHRVDKLVEPGSPLAEWVNQAAVNRIVREHHVGRRDHSPLLWKLIVLQLWVTLTGTRGRCSGTGPAAAATRT